MSLKYRHRGLWLQFHAKNTAREKISVEHARYPAAIKKHFPKATHRQYKSIRGCVTGQGELKKTQFDPLFSINHTLAMLRAKINRLVRRTWCTTKKNERLEDHMALYVDYHNRILIHSPAT